MYSSPLQKALHCMVHLKDSEKACSKEVFPAFSKLTLTAFDRGALFLEV